mgnify:CR=1 FL=1
MMKKLPRWVSDLLLSLLSGLVLGGILSGFCVGNFWQSFFAFSLFSWVGLFALIRAWRFFGAQRSLAILMAVALFLRLAVAVIGSSGLPKWGYNNEVNKAGFFYSDAYDRDKVAYQLAVSDKALFTAFTMHESVDQYGGLLFISALIYRTFSPDQARPLLISLLAALVSTLGIAFFWSALQKRWSLKISNTAAWILAIFPDAVLLGSSQMREPFLIALICIAFWAILDWQAHPLRTILITLPILGLSCLFSVPAGGIFAAILASTIVLEWSLSQKNSSLRKVGLFTLIVVGLAALAGGWLWLRSTLYYDSYTTMMDSGFVQDLLRRKIGVQWMIPFTSVYGLTQPLLPAAIMEPSIAIWKTIAILRGFGWYTALPLLLFAFFAVFKADTKESRWLLTLYSLVFLLWVVVSSVRAGGDLWDNPRYRYILLPFMALLISWAIYHYRHFRSAWLWRWIAVVFVFLTFFMILYVCRYTGIHFIFSFTQTIFIIALLTFVILAGGLIWDMLKRHRKGSSRNG